MLFGAKSVHFPGNRNRRLSNSIPIPDFGIEYPVPGFDSGRPSRHPLKFHEVYLRSLPILKGEAEKLLRTQLIVSISPEHLEQSDSQKKWVISET